MTSQKIAAKRKRGRPASTSAKTDAERQQLSRARKSKAIYGIARTLLAAKDRGDWMAVETAANALLML